MFVKKVSGWVKSCFLTAAMGTMLLLQPAGAAAATGDEAAKAELESAYAAMETVKSGNVGMDVLLDTLLMDVTGNLDMNFAMEPTFRAEGTLKLVIGDAKQPSTKRYAFYTLEDEKNYTVYYKEDSQAQWYKEVTSKDKVNKDKQAEEKDPSYQALLQELKDCHEAVNFGDGNDQQQTYRITVDGEKLWPAIGTYLRGKVKPGDKNAKDVEAVLGAIGSIGDLEYEVTVDKASNQVVSGRMDLTKPVSNFIRAILDEGSLDEKNKVLMNMMLSNAKLNVEMHGSKYNQVSGVEVPESVVKNAKPAPKDKENKKDKK